jgi:hypothetical protein
MFAAHLINAQTTVTVTVTVDRLTMTDVVSAADPTSQLAVPTDAPTTAEAFTTE